MLMGIEVSEWKEEEEEKEKWRKGKRRNSISWKNGRVRRKNWKRMKMKPIKRVKIGGGGRWRRRLRKKGEEGTAKYVTPHRDHKFRK